MSVEVEQAENLPLKVKDLYAEHIISKFKEEKVNMILRLN